MSNAKKSATKNPFLCYINRDARDNPAGFYWFIGWTASVYEGCRYADFIFRLRKGERQRGIMIAYVGDCPSEESVIEWIRVNDSMGR
jgi:hypothetical protein